jgi:hypothetical protein
MKRIAVLLVVLMMGLSLYGCGANGKSGTTSSSSDNGSTGSTSNPTGTPSGPVTSFTLNLVDNAASATRMVNTGSGHQPSDARVVIRRFDQVGTVQQICTSYSPTAVDADGAPVCDIFSNVTVTTYAEVWKDIQDNSYTGTGTLQVGIPVGNGYTIDVITALYSNQSRSYDILSYGTTSNVNVAGNGSSSIVMQSVPAILRMSVTDPVVTKGKFEVDLNNGLPFNSSYQLTTNYGGIIDIGSNPSNTVPMATETISASSNKIIKDMPSSYTTGTINVSAQFTIYSTFLKSGEAATKWKRQFPDSAYGESAYSIFIPFSQVNVSL